jgi:hypothetical protein
MDLLIVLDPVSSLLLHLLHDFITLVFQNLCFDNFPGCFKIIHVLHSCLAPFFLGVFHSLDGIAHFFLDSHWPASHPQEKELFLANCFNLFPSKYALYPLLDEQVSSIFFLLGSLFFNQALTDLFA